MCQAPKSASAMSSVKRRSFCSLVVPKAQSLLGTSKHSLQRTTSCRSVILITFQIRMDHRFRRVVTKKRRQRLTSARSTSSIGPSRRPGSSMTSFSAFSTCQTSTSWLLASTTVRFTCMTCASKSRRTQVQTMVPQASVTLAARRSRSSGVSKLRGILETTCRTLMMTSTVR